jgi:serine/threonine-protein kinase
VNAADAIKRLNAALEGRYRIERQLGEGGMATVYLAEDLRHERTVALKVLKPELAAVVGAERFLNEIKTTANLKHPHILPLFDSGEADSFLFYVMPFVEGESLRERLDREHQLPVDEAVQIAKNVAEALDNAHRHGVIHRDIKPANILLQDGKPVVSDFGIALALGVAGAGRLTETGLSLGTPHYMSPEQATGDLSVGAPTDMYALGCVLYEMLVGEPPYTGSTPQAVLGKIVTGEAPSATAQRRSVPLHVDATIRRALEKVPADRFEGMSGFIRALGDPGFRHRMPESAYDVVSPGSRMWKHAALAFAALAIALGATVLRSLSQTSNADGGDILRLTMATHAGAPLTPSAVTRDIGISPDGTQVVYRGTTPDGTRSQLYLRRLDSFDAGPLLGSEDGYGGVISPDGQWVAFATGIGTGMIKKVSILGGTASTLVEFSGQVAGLRWVSNDLLVTGIAPGRGLFLVPAGGGDLQPLATSIEGSSFVNPSPIPDRNVVLFSENFGGAHELAAVDLGTGEVVRLGIEGISPRYVTTGHLLYAVPDGSLRAVPFDSESLSATGAAATLIEGLTVKFPQGEANFDVSDDGRLVYTTGDLGNVTRRLLVWVDRDGGEEPVAAPSQAYWYPRLSPDGNRIAVDVRGSSNDILMWDLVRETASRIVSGEGVLNYPIWTPDGQRVAYAKPPGIYMRAANGTGSEELVADSTGDAALYFFTPDGTQIVYRDTTTPETGSDLSILTVDDDPTDRRRLIGGANRQVNAELSPDGRWVAYESDESGRAEVYVRPYPDVEADRIQISNLGGRYPLWSRDGRELFYLQQEAASGRSQLVSVSIEAGREVDSFSFRGREVVMEWPYLASTPGRPYDVSPDGRRLLAIGMGDAAAQLTEINVVLNWFEELRQRVPVD